MSAVDPTDVYIAALTATQRAALRLTLSDELGNDHANSDAQVEYDVEQLCLAARDLVRAVDALDPNERPVRWDDDDLDPLNATVTDAYQETTRGPF